MKKIIILTGVIIFSIAFAINCVSAQEPPAYVEVFEEYAVDIVVSDDDSAHIKIDAVIRNNIDKPIVPGYVVFTFYRVEQSKILGISNPFSDKKTMPLDIQNVKAYTNNEEVSSSSEKLSERTIIRVDVWEPLPPKEKKRISLEYDVENISEGMLFKEIEMPIGYSELMPIEVQKVKITLPQKITYAYGAKVSGRTAEWEARNIPPKKAILYLLEYSKIPMPLLSFRSYWLFWGIIIIILLILLFVFIRKKRAKK